MPRGPHATQRRGVNGRAIPGLAPRRAAAELLADVIDQRHPLDARLGADDAASSGLAVQDRALARAIVATTLRRYGQIRDALSRLIERPLPKRAGMLPRILEITAAQVMFMEIADHASVSLALALTEADDRARHFKSLANGVLRTLARRRAEITGSQDAPRLNTPEWLWNSWASTYGGETARAIAKAHLAELPLDLSVKADPEVWADRVGGVALPTGSVRLSGTHRVTTMPGFDEGAWWVQDVAAALPARLLGDVSGKRVADLCAAPGGKTAQLSAAGAIVTAVDNAPTRMRRLQENLDRLRLHAECVVADALAFDPGPVFDAVLVDAPCSATGTIRRHPDIAWLKRAEDVEALGKIQRLLLAQATKIVRPGGAIVFTTCSLQPEEGLQIVADIEGLPITPLPIQPGEFNGLRSEWLANGWLRTLPHLHAADSVVGMDGFFAARFRRR